MTKTELEKIPGLLFLKNGFEEEAGSSSSNQEKAKLKRTLESEILKSDPQWFADFVAEWRKRKVKDEKVEG